MDATADVRVRTSGKRDDEAELRESIDARIRAVRVKRMSRAHVGYASDVVTFDVVAPLVNKGVDAVRKTSR